MGCLRSGFSFVITLILTVFLTGLGAFLGSLLPLASGNSYQSASLSGPLDMIQANPTGALIGGGIGALLGLFIMVRVMKRASDVTWLKKNGTRITATVTKIETIRNNSYSNSNQMQSRTYYVVVASWYNPQLQQVYTFRSEQRSLYPRKYASGSGISVLIDPLNLRRYFVEV